MVKNLDPGSLECHDSLLAWKSESLRTWAWETAWKDGFILIGLEIC